MRNAKSILLAGAILLTHAGAYAQKAEAPAAEIMATEAPGDGDLTEAEVAQRKAAQQAEQQKMIDEMLAAIGKLFDPGALPPAAAARLQPASITASKLLPNGTMARMMDNMVGTFMKAFTALPDSFGDMRLSMNTGVESKKLKTLTPAKREAIADLFDPHRAARAEQLNQVLTPFFKSIFAEMEPAMRAGMARAYARRFNADQIAAINAFFATPAGEQFAADTLVLQADREVMAALIKAMPAMLPKMIEKGTAVEKDLKTLPKERTLSDLNDQELGRLAALLDVPVQQLQDRRAMLEPASSDSTAEMADAASDASPVWSQADQKNVEQKQAAFDAAYEALTKAQEQADANARGPAGPKKQP